MEEWRVIEDFPDYKVSSYGNIKNKEGQILATQDMRGYRRISFRDASQKSCQRFVHRLVGDTFLEPRDGRQINHINGIKDDNRITNLEWVTQEENMQHAYRTGLKTPSGPYPAKRVQIIETGEIFESLSSCARYLDGSIGNLQQHLRGVYHTFKGHHVREVDNKTPIGIALGRHQIDAIEKLDSGKILNGGVGLGKSRTAIAYFFLKECGGSLMVNGVGSMSSSMDSPKDLIIITTAMKRDSGDWLRECAPFCLTTDPEVSVGGVRVIIDSWNNISKYEGIENAFFVLDEQRLVGTGTWVKSFLKIVKKNRWILLSATAGDTWLDFAPVFIANGWYKNITEFKREHCVYSYYGKFPKIEKYVSVGRLIRYRNQLLVEMPYLRHTTRVTREVKTDYNKSLMEEVQKKRWNVFEEIPLRDAADLHSVARKVVNTDSTRYQTILNLLTVHPKMIVFYNFNFERDILLKLKEEVEVAEWSGHAHQPVPTGDRWCYLVQFQAGSEGWNCVTTDTTVFYSLPYSYKAWHQAHGRIDRLNTPFETLYYYILKSNSWIDNAIWKNLKVKKSFNEARDGAKWEKFVLST